MNDVSLLIATVSSRLPQWDYTVSMVRAISWLQEAARGLPEKYRIAYETEHLYATDAARNRLAMRAVKMGATHISFVDDDMSIPAEAFAMLLNAGKPVVAANYVGKWEPSIPLAMKDGKRVESWGKTGLEKVDRAPTGVMLIETSVFEALKLPYFQTTFRPEFPTEPQSDDFYFCDKARAAGFDIWIDHDLSLKVDHVGTKAFRHMAPG